MQKFLEYDAFKSKTGRKDVHCKSSVKISEEEKFRFFIDIKIPMVKIKIFYGVPHNLAYIAQ